MVRWEDLKERGKSIFFELRNQTMGLIGLGIILFMLTIAILAPFIAPNTNGQDWDDVEKWQDNPKKAAPVWIDYLTPKSLADHKIKNYPDNEPEENNDIVNIRFKYNNKYDKPPLDLILYIKGTFDGPSCTMHVSLIRPDSYELENISEEPEYSGMILPHEIKLVEGKQVGKNGTLDSRTSLLRSPDQRDAIYNFGMAWVNKVYEKPLNDTIPQIKMSSEDTAFGKANEDMLSSPDALKGEYILDITIFGQNIDLNFGKDESRLIFAGQTYGWMGTDDLGRDIALGWVWGARYALILSTIVASTAVIIGTFYGMTSAYFGGWVDEFMQRANEVVIGIPILPVLILMMYVLKPSLWIMMALLVLLYWRGIAKTIRARGLQVKQETYVEASESLGSSGGRVITRHMIPQILPYSVAEAALLVPIVIILEAGLSVIGLGDPSIVTWGRILSRAQGQGATVQGLWWWVLLPGIGIALMGFAFISSGLAIERIVNPKMRQR